MNERSGTPEETVIVWSSSFMTTTGRFAMEEENEPNEPIIHPPKTVKQLASLTPSFSIAKILAFFLLLFKKETQF